MHNSKINTMALAQSFRNMHKVKKKNFSHLICTFLEDGTLPLLPILVQRQPESSACMGHIQHEERSSSSEAHWLELKVHYYP